MRSFRVSARLAALVSAGLVASSLAALAPSASAAADVATIKGTVTAPAGTDLRTVWVWGYVNSGNGWQRQAKDVAADGTVQYTRAQVAADGTYTLGVPAATDYRLEFTDANGELINEYYTSPDTDAGKVTDGKSIPVSNGATVTADPIALVKGAIIRGFVKGNGSTQPRGVIDTNGMPDVVAALVDPATGNYMLGDFTDHDAVGVVNPTEQPGEVVDDTALGEYKIGGVRPGTYKLRFFASTTRSYADQFYKGAYDLASASSITVGAFDAPRTIETVTLEPQGIISGRILKPVLATEGAEKTFVQARRVTLSGKEYRPEWTTYSAPADSTSALKGQYTIASLPQGTYQVCAYPTGQPVYCFDAKTDTTANAVSVSPGQVLRGTDIVLGTRPAAPPTTAPAPTTPPATTAPAPTPTATPTIAPTLPVDTVDTVQLQNAPKVKGKMLVGSKIWVTKFKFVPANAKVTYRWFAGNKRIKKANKWALKLTRAQRNKTIKVRIIVSYPGLKPAVRTLKFKGKVR